MALIVGIQHLRDGIEPQSVIGADLAVVGIVGTAPGADADVFPLNRPVEVRTNDSARRVSLGAAGTIPDSLAALSAQLAGVGAAKCVVVRVDEELDPFDTIANILGNEGNRTGVWALLDAPEELGITPRLLVVPGFTSQAKSGLGEVTITSGGSGGTDGTFDLGFSGGSGSGGAGTFTVVGGAVTTVTITEPGEYTAAPTLTFTDSSNLAGTNVTVSLEQLANPVCALMPTITERLRAHFLPEGPSSTRQAALDWMETLPRSARFLHPLRQDAKVLDSEGDLVTKPLSPFVIGLYVRADALRGGIPSRSAANLSVNGLVGVTPSVPFSLIDANSLGQTDLEQSFGIVVKGDIGVDGAISDGGFVFWGTDTLSSDTQWLFANVTRMRDYMELLQVRALRRYLGENITLQTIQAIINTMESQLVVLEADSHILGYRIGFDEDVNTPEELRQGTLRLMFMAEEPPVLRKLIIQSRRHREALENLASMIALSLSTDIAA